MGLRLSSLGLVSKLGGELQAWRWLEDESTALGKDKDLTFL
jgi:hypothetical protein